MPNRSGRFRGIGSGVFLSTLLVLVLQGVASRAFTIRERELPIPALHTVPMEIAGWRAPVEESLEQDVTDYLKPDVYILRDYQDGSKSSSINLFVAYFKSLKNVYGPHSPRVCLPGAGWLVRSSTIASVPVPGRPEGIPVNEYVMEKSESQILVLYWYQNNRNVWAEEFQEKLRLLSDMVRYRRSDVSLVRIIIPMNGKDPDKELVNSIRFTQALFPRLSDIFATAP
jgi:EpsI family protein